MAYATIEQVEAGFRELDADEQAVCTALLDEAAVMIDAAAPNADADVRRVVSCRMVRRVIGSTDTDMTPIGTTQGTVSAGGYSQTWTVGGTTGELYLSKTEKAMLGVGNRLGAHSPLEGTA